MKRRDFLAATVTAAAAADPLVAALTRLQALADSSLGVAVDGFEAAVTDLGLTYGREPVERLQVRLDGLLGAAQGVLGAGADARYRARLMSVAGWSAGLLSNALYDAGDPAAAGLNATMALEYGRRTGDQRLIAYVRDRQAMYADFAGDLLRALELKAAGLAVAPAGSAIAVRLAGAGARLHAKLGHREMALAMLRQMDAAQDRLDPSERGEGSLSVGPVALDGALGNVMGALGDLDAAVPHVRVVVDHYAAATGAHRRPTRLAVSQLNLAMLVAQQGRPDEAAELGTAALQSERLVAPVRQDAGKLANLFGSRWPDVPETRAYRERYLALA